MTNFDFTAKVPQASALEKAEGAEAAASLWLEIWQATMRLEKWYFVHQGSTTNLTPAKVWVDTKPAIAIFTNLELAQAFATEHDLDIEDVFASKPAQTVSSIDDLIANGIELSVFNPGPERFVIQNRQLQALYMACTQAKDGLSPEQKLDAALSAARRASGTDAARAVQEEVWYHALKLPKWHFIARGEKDAPLPLTVENQNHEDVILAFSSPQAASRFITERKTEGMVLAMQTPKAITWLKTLLTAGQEADTKAAKRSPAIALITERYTAQLPAQDIFDLNDSLAVINN